MRFIIVFATVFSLCCCISDSNPFPIDATTQNLYQFYETKRSPLNIVLTDEEVLRCQNFTDNIKELDQRLSEELQEILSQCRQLLQQKSKLSGSKNENDSIQLPAFENKKMQEQYFITEEHSTLESSKEKDKNAEQNESSSTEKPVDKHENQKKELDSVTLNSTNTNWSLWKYFFGDRGSSESSRSVLVKQNESKSNEKQTYKLENQKMELKTANSTSSTNTNWNLWYYLFGARNSSYSSYETRPFENFEIGSATESDIYFEKSTDLEYSESKITSAWNIVMPGTKWCGSGSTAENDDDLGYFEDVDRCCRAHDKCNDLMPPGVSKYNLTNTSQFTALHCKCDDELYHCLDKIDSVASNTVGNTFFNIFGRMCYTLDYPKICKKHTLFGCLEYVIDETAEKVFQWKPAKKYLKMPFTIPG